jgi:hypothetical protein
MRILSADAVALAAAHGITQRVVDTWWPGLWRGPRVLVPVKLDVLMVRAVGGTWADCLMQTPPGDGTHRDLLPAPFKNRKARSTGAYLHWALPSALTRASAPAPASDGSVAFPAIPDRWAVIRISGGLNPAVRTLRGWILQSGDHEVQPRDLDGWTEPGRDTTGLKGPLTALGHGDAAWAAYYDNCENRLAFHDPLDDKFLRGPISYVVCGWYADPSMDPLADPSVQSRLDFEKLLAEFGWRLPDTDFDWLTAQGQNWQYWSVAQQIGLQTSFVAPGNQPQPWWPTQTMLHGAAVGIGWPGVGLPGYPQGLLPGPPTDGNQRGEAGGPPPPDQIKVSIGDTIPDALAQLVAQENGAPDEERLCSAFLLGILPELDQSDGRARTDAALHASSFVSESGGTTTEQIWQPATPVTQSPPANPAPPEPGIFGQPPPTPIRHPPSIPLPKFAGGEKNVIAGDLGAVLRWINPPPFPVQRPGQWITVQRTLPRLFHPHDPVVLVQGGGRSFKHGRDDLYSQDGTLHCRLGGMTVSELTARYGDEGDGVVFIHGVDLLDRGAENGSIPPEVEEIVIEATLLDPGSAYAAEQWWKLHHKTPEARVAGAPAPTLPDGALAARITVEQTAWWATRDRRVDVAPIASLSGLNGTLPSPAAISPPLQPWAPRHLDWEIDYFPSANGVGDWSLGEIDYSPTNLPPAEGAQATRLNGRALLSGGAADLASAAAQAALTRATQAGGASQLTPGQLLRFNSTITETIISALGDVPVPSQSSQSAINRAQLADIADALSNIDVLSGGLDSFHQGLRDGTTFAAAPLAMPLVPLRAGFLRVRRLRLVDAFGQAVDLAGSSDTQLADPSRVLRSAPMVVDGRAELAALPPRFTAPARVWFRFLDGAGGDDEADAQTSPVAGYVMPNHLDAALEFFAPDGTNLGVVRRDDDAGVVWEDAPGTPSTVGQSPTRAISNTSAAAMADSLVRWGVTDQTAKPKDGALVGMLRTIDSTRWSVDPFGHTGDEHLSLLMGHPVAVVRAMLRLDVNDPGATDDPLRAVPVRLGSLAHWQDGLFGYFVDDDYTTLYVARAAREMAREIGPGRGYLQAIDQVAAFHQSFTADLQPDGTGGSPVEHPFVTDGELLAIRPGQTIRLTMLVEPHTFVHATAGLVPRKEIGLRREWIADALAKLAPTFRFGPVLVDPKTIRMPIPTDIQGGWAWDHHGDVTVWNEDAVTNANQDALLPDDPARAQEGWLRFEPKQPTGSAK